MASMSRFCVAFLLIVLLAPPPARSPGPQSLVPEQINAWTDVEKCRVVCAILNLEVVALLRPGNGVWCAWKCDEAVST